MTFKSVNPATEQQIAEYELLSDTQLDQAITASDQAFSDWRRTSFEERAKFMRKAGAGLRDNKSEYAKIMTQEMGKPITQAEAEVDKCAWVCDYNAENAEKFLADETIETDAGKSFISYRPMGAIFAIMPWNYPFWQVFRFLAPHLMSGNTGLLKHAPNVGGCAKAIEDVFQQAGFPENVFHNLFIDEAQAGKVIEDSRVRAVTLTGSVGAGRAVAAQAGKALKKVVLELGGSDAYIILEDADLETAVDVCVSSRLINSGQSCVNAKRFIVTEPLREQFTEAVKERIGAAQPGDPMDPETKIGPLARGDLRDNLNAQVDKSVTQGAKRLVGAEIKNGKGYFYQPGALSNLAPGMPAYDEELFGPVASIINARDEDDAIRIVNKSRFGLGSGVISKDEQRACRIARDELDAGMSFVNSFVASDPRLPFGGVKDSGYGRELSTHGIREFVNIKTVSVR